MQCSWVNFLNTQVFDDEIRNEDYFYYQLHSGEVFVDHITVNDQCEFCLQLRLPNARKQALMHLIQATSDGQRMPAGIAGTAQNKPLDR